MGRPKKNPEKKKLDNNVFSLFGEKDKAEAQPGTQSKEVKPNEKYPWGDKWLSVLNDELFYPA